jgi:HNH endonuclease
MNNCIEWGKCLSKAGYGVKRLAGKNVYAHRLAYCERHGLTLDEIKGSVVMHTCDNPKCVNPDHLLLGTQAENMKDMRIKKRTPLGENRKSSKLTTHDVIEIRASYDRGERKPRLLAKKYGVSYYTILKIGKRKPGSSWSWL